MAMQIRRVGAAAMVVFDPGLGAVGVAFLFPDRQAVLEVVDEIAAGQG